MCGWGNINPKETKRFLTVIKVDEEEGPKEIIKASHQVELYDEELNCEPYKKIGIKTLKFFKIDKNIRKALNKISNINKEILGRTFNYTWVYCSFCKKI